MTDERLRILEREALAGSKDALDELVRLRMREVRRPEAHTCWICRKTLPLADWPAHLDSCGMKPRAGSAGSEQESRETFTGSFGGVAARVLKVPLWSRATLCAGETSTSFFLHGNDGHSNLGLGSPWGLPCLPRDHHFIAFGLALVPDADSDHETLSRAWNVGSAFFGLGYAPQHEWPARAVMTNPALLPRLEAGYAAGFDSPRVLVTVKDKPLQIQCLEGIVSGFRVPEPLAEPLTFMLILYGIRLRPITS